MPKPSKKANAKHSKKASKTRRFVAKKGLVGGPLGDEALRFLEFKGMTRTDLVNMIGKNPDGSFKRGSKTMGAFIFTVIPKAAANNSVLGSVFIQVQYKDNLKDKVMI